MKVIQLADGFYPLIGGGSLAIRTWIENMPDVEFEVVTNSFSSQPLIENYQFSNNCKIKRFLPDDITYSNTYRSKYKILLFQYKLFSDFIRFHRKIKYLKNTEYDILHFNGPLTNYAFFSIDRKLNHPFFTKFNKKISSIDKPKVMTLHGLPSEFTQNKIDLINENNMIEIFNNIICVEKYIASKVEAYCEKNNLDTKVFFIPNSVDINLFEFTPLNYSPRLKVGFVGRLTEDRGLNFLIELLHNFPDFIEIHITGLGNKKAIQNHIHKIPSDRIHFDSDISYEEMPNIYKKMDILFNPVKVQGISRASLESMACGRPVIMVNNGDRYPTINNKTGFIIKEDINELLNLLEYLYNNRNILKTLGENARKIIICEFSHKIITPKIEKIYSDLME